MYNNLIKSLRDILEKERLAIIAGKFEIVDELSSSKQDTFEQLIRSKPNPHSLKSIENALIRNQSLFSSAIEGVKSAQSRLDALREVREGLSVYDRSGRLAQVSAKGPGLSKHT